MSGQRFKTKAVLRKAVLAVPRILVNRCFLLSVDAGVDLHVRPCAFRSLSRLSVDLYQCPMVLNGQCLRRESRNIGRA